MVDANGQSTTADFLVRKIGDSYHVVQMLVGERPLVEAAMKKMGQ
jgi:dihydroxyacetone kinase